MIPFPLGAWITPESVDYGVCGRSAKILLPLTGTNGSTTITDNGSSPDTWAVQGSTAISTAQYPSGITSSLYISNSSSTVGGAYSTASTNTRILDSSEFTLEMWVYLNSAPGSNGYVLASKWSDPASGFLFDLNSARSPRLAYPFFSAGDLSTLTVPVTTWCHVAVCGVGTSSSRYIHFAVNGSVIRTASPRDVSSINSGTGVEPAVSLKLGYDGNSGTLNTYLNGYIAGFRITHGCARYTAPDSVGTYSYTIPTLPLPTP